MAHVDPVVLVEVDSLKDAAHLASAFVTWAGPDADLRVLFTPDVLIAVDNDAGRGYLYDDGWSVEAWIERGSVGFLAVLDAEFAGPTDSGYRVGNPPGTARNHRGLTEMAIDKGHPIADVRHLL